MCLANHSKQVARKSSGQPPTPIERSFWSFVGGQRNHSTMLRVPRPRRKEKIEKYVETVCVEGSNDSPKIDVKARMNKSRLSVNVA
jgi:hypothetical protein